MSRLVPIINTQGPLPLTATVQVNSDAPIILAFSGSAWSNASNTMIGVSVSMDGAQVGTATIFANPSSTHLALVSFMIPITTTIGPHKFVIAPLNANTTSDSNDHYALSLIY